MTVVPFQIPNSKSMVVGPSGTLTDEWRRFFTMLAQNAGSGQSGDGFVSTGGEFYPVSALLNPTGTLLPFAGLVSAVPSGWLLCDGSAVSRTVYSELFAVLGTAWGVGNGTTTFNLPNFAKNTGVPWTPASALLPILSQINWIIKT